jgi:hypothetical protein
MQAFLRSLQDQDTGRHVMGVIDRVTRTDGDNSYLAHIGERRYTAIYNPFCGAYFVDDVDGFVS